MVAIRRRLDMFGVLVLSVATGVAGGIFLGFAVGCRATRSAAHSWPLVVCSLADISAFFFKRQIEQFKRPVMLLDAIGLGVFAVAGCRKAMIYGLEPPGAVLLGVMTAIGGGVLRDIMVAEVPRILHEDIYALAALVGAVAYASFLWLGIPEV